MLFKLLIFGLPLLPVYSEINVGDAGTHSGVEKADPKIFHAERITPGKDTVNSMPIFDKTGRLVYFQGKGEKYGTTKCAHIYQLDLATKDISLFSTGLGHESRVGLERDVTTKYNEPTVISTASYAFEKLANGLRRSDFSNDDLCPPSPCTTTPVAQCNEAHFERYDDEGLYEIDVNGKVRAIHMHKDDEDKPTGSVDTICLAPKIFAASNSYVLHTCAGSGDNGDALTYKKQNNEIKNVPGFESGAFDGFHTSSIADKADTKGHFFFHGYQFTGVLSDNDKKTIAAIKAGIIPRKGSVIFQGTVDDLYANPVVIPSRINGLDGNKDYVFPFSASNGIVVVTGYDQTTNKSALYSLDISSTDSPVLLTSSDYNTEFGVLDKSNKYIVFKSDRQKTEDQLYIGLYLDRNAKSPRFISQSPDTMKASFSSYILSSKNYYNNDMYAIDYKFRSPKISKSSGMLMYTSGDEHDIHNYCPQIYQIDPKWNDTTVRRKMTTGIHAYESPNFLDEDDILYAATLTKNYLNAGETNKGPYFDLCRVDVCAYGSPGYNKVQTICSGVTVKKPIHPESELYISNKYGSIKKRLTINDVYDGEVAVWNSDYVVYSSYDSIKQDLDLYLMRLTDKNPELSRTKLTDTLGYEGSVTFSQNGGLIAYEANRPFSFDEINTYIKQLDANFVSLDQTQIYFYHFDSKREYQLTSGYSVAYSPTFIDSKRLVFLSSSIRGYTPSLMLANIRCVSTGCTFTGPEKLEDYSEYVYNIFFQPDLNSMAFTTDEGVYLSKNVKTQNMIIAPPTPRVTTTTVISPNGGNGGNGGNNNNGGNGGNDYPDDYPEPRRHCHFFCGAMQVYGSSVMVLTTIFTFVVLFF